MFSWRFFRNCRPSKFEVFSRIVGIPWWNADFTTRRVRRVRPFPFLESGAIRFEEYLNLGWSVLIHADLRCEQQVSDNYFHEDSHFFQILYQPCYLRAQLHVLGFLKESMTPVDLINSFCADFHVRSASVLRNTVGVQSDMPCPWQSLGLYLATRTDSPRRHEACCGAVAGGGCAQCHISSCLKIV